MRLLMSFGLVFAAIGAGPAAAQPETDADRQAAMAEMFGPYDDYAKTGWEQVFPAALVRRVATGGAEPIDLSLKPGGYTVVVLCKCKGVEVTLLDPGGRIVSPLKRDDWRAMYSLDVPKPGNFLLGVDMGDCDEAACDVAVKAYRKTAP